MSFPSPNHGERRLGPPDMILIHYTGMETCAAARERLCDPEAEVSAHYLIDLDGTVEQLVDERRRAWHAGVSEWEGESDVNSRSIGIELVNQGAGPNYHPFPEAQMATLEGLLAEISSRWTIDPRLVRGHSDVAPGRKIDPGPKFDWKRLERAGLAKRTM
ncbi:MAG: N-acetylmuramoyl-L-alanine amidase [Pseudomonadota bacterium]